MADVEDYAVIVAETNWGAFPCNSAVFIGFAAMCYLFSLKISPTPNITAHEYVFGSDDLQQAGGDATSAFLKASTIAQTPTQTVIQTVTATADPHKVASSLAKQLLPRIDSRIASLEKEIVAMQARNFLFMMIGSLLIFLLTSAFWYFLMYQPLYQAFREERDRNTGARQTTVNLPPAPKDPHKAVQLADGECPNDNGGLSDEKSINTETINVTPAVSPESNTVDALADGDHPKDNGTPLDRRSDGTVDMVPSPKEAISEEQSTAPNSPPQTPPVTEVQLSEARSESITTEPTSTSIPTTPDQLITADVGINSEDAVDAAKGNALITSIDQKHAAPRALQLHGRSNDTRFTLQPERHQDDLKEAGPGKALPKREEAIIDIIVFTSCPLEGKTGIEQLFDILNSYASWIHHLCVLRIYDTGNQEAIDEINRGTAEIADWIKADQRQEGIYPAKRAVTRRKRLERKLHEHFQTVHTPPNLATLQNHKEDIQEMMSDLKNVKKDLVAYHRLKEQLIPIKSMVPTVLIYVFDNAIAAHLSEVRKAAQEADHIVSTTQLSVTAEKKPATGNSQQGPLAQDNIASEPVISSTNHTTQQHTPTIISASVEEAITHGQTAEEETAEKHNAESSPHSHKNAIEENASFKSKADDKEDSSGEATEKEADGLTGSSPAEVVAPRKKLPVSSRKVAGLANESGTGDAKGTERTFAGVVREMNQRGS